MGKGGLRGGAQGLVHINLEWSLARREVGGGVSVC